MPSKDKDVEMKDAEKEEEKKQEGQDGDKKDDDDKKEKLTAACALDFTLTLCARANNTGEGRFVARLLRHIPKVRKLVKDEPAALLAALNPYLNDEVRQVLTPVVEAEDAKIEKLSAMDVDTDEKQEEKRAQTKTASAPSSSESRLWSNILAVIFLIDSKHYAEAFSVAETSMKVLLEERKVAKRKTTDPLGAKTMFYYARAHELSGSSAPIRKSLLEAFRTASLRHDIDGQATLLNLLLRNYLAHNLYDQADKLISKTNLSEQDTPAAQFARYLYYKGRIQAIQLDYSDASRCLIRASRKAPQEGALGFRKAVNKLAVIVQLLMGEMPERTVFRQRGMVRALQPYFELTQAVRIGDVANFQKVVEANRECFARDDNTSLIQRLRRNVIKIGLRKINLSYSRIFLSDVCAKLHLESELDAEFIVAKAIRDGVIDATIDHEGKFLQSKETVDIYSTAEPQEAFHNRIMFCLNLHNDAVKAMRFPPNAYKKSVEIQEEVKNLQKEEAELVKELEEEEDDEL